MKIRSILNQNTLAGLYLKNNSFKSIPALKSIFEKYDGAALQEKQYDNKQRRPAEISKNFITID